MSDLSLRERSKRRRRRAIQMHAMRLFAARGYDATTVSEIAAAAEVSPRSVSSYFPTKLDIATASFDEAAERLVKVIGQVGPNRQLVDAFMIWLENEPSFVDEEEWELRARMLDTNPALANVATAHSRTLQEVASAVIAQDLSIPLTDVTVRLVLGMFEGLVLQSQLLPVSHRSDIGVFLTIRTAISGVLDDVRRLRVDEAR
ncbi:TetR/AcrR family transcriptional regulator [Clavibacter michiganensis subsp. michiganensis]|uniref:TetR/AcrR family transcriptional regulator n=1 Tax=Clavibacter michiganensis TaxID=28447 RepID=UPI0019D3D7B6|nr:TetR/AcrR family transcriptional regulator [Clavibacter michiganensis]MDO4099302.1 helix-turn-helix domain-containing protein [Clavibacter michiganensis]QXP04638.1 TetR/AcrR family transcriptional regulator [Clavibacter michiganensis subsp. michiganensis]